MIGPISQGYSQCDREAKADPSLFGFIHLPLCQLLHGAWRVVPTKSTWMFCMLLDQPLNPNTSFARLMHLSADK